MISKNSKKMQEADVLYQKLGAKWFAFSVVDDEVYVASFDPKVLHRKKAPSQKRPTIQKLKKAS